MTFYSSDPRAVKVYDLLHVFFDDLYWGDTNSDFIFQDGLFLYPDKDLCLATSDNYIEEIYLALKDYFSPLSPWGVLSGVRPLKILHLERDEGKGEEDIFHDLLNRDHISESKARLLMEIADHQHTIYHSDRDKLSLYLSVPFCPTICSYCCFHTRPYQPERARIYMRELLHDLAYAKECIAEKGREVDCIYIGGGTPWVLGVEELERLFMSLTDFKKAKEWTFEGGRIDALDEEKADCVARYANRVCLNPQSLTKGITPLMGRPEAEHLSGWIEYFKGRGLVTASDLIAGLPGESLEEFLDSLKELIAMAPDNITLHNLSIKKGALLKKAEAAPTGAMLEGGYDLLKHGSYQPYYIYRQKNMIGRGENVGYEKGETPCIYNIRMMEDAHEILALGSNAAGKKIRHKKVLRSTTPKDIQLYIEDRPRRKKIIKDFFE